LIVTNHFVKLNIVAVLPQGHQLLKALLGASIRGNLAMADTDEADD